MFVFLGHRSSLSHVEYRSKFLPPVVPWQCASWSVSVKNIFETFLLLQNAPGLHRSYMLKVETISSVSMRQHGVSWNEFYIGSPRAWQPLVGEVFIYSPPTPSIGEVVISSPLKGHKIFPKVSFPPWLHPVKIMASNSERIMEK